MPQPMLTTGSVFSAMNRGLWVVLLLATLIVPCDVDAMEATGTATGTTPVAKRTATSPHPDVVSRLIGQLGAGRFSVRERASTDLREMGLCVYETLQNVQDHPDRETRLRVNALLAELIQVDRQVKLESFITQGGDQDVERSDNDTALPGWKRFRELVGDSSASRELMAEMLRDNWELLAKAESDGESGGGLLIQRCEELQYSLSLRREQVTRADVATLLLLAVDPDVGVYKNTQQQIYNFCFRIRIAPPPSDGGEESVPLRKLLGAWVARPVDVANTAFYSLNIALRYSLPEGLVPATQILAENNAAPYIRQYAILTVGRFNDLASRDKLEALLNDESICYTQTDPSTKNVTFQSQIRDVALATLIHLTGQNPADFGFERLRPSASMVYQPNTLGFTTEKKRIQAFAAYHKLRAAADHIALAVPSASNDGVPAPE